MPDSAPSHHVLTARDVMAHSLVTIPSTLSIFEAIRLLISRTISGAPVVGPDGEMIGMLSEVDCLAVLASDQFHADAHVHPVSDYMSTTFETISPDTDIYTLALYFRDKPVRRFPVVENGRLLGQVSRRDVLRGVDEMRRKRAHRKHYPDYREPA
jgi:predicted transcriptional regulator